MGQQKKISRFKHLHELGEPVIVHDTLEPPEDIGEPIVFDEKVKAQGSQNIHPWKEFWTVKLWQGLIIAVLAAAIVGSLSSTWRGS